MARFVLPETLIFQGFSDRRNNSRDPKRLGDTRVFVDYPTNSLGHTTGSKYGLRHALDRWHHR